MARTSCIFLTVLLALGGVRAVNLLSPLSFNLLVSPIKAPIEVHAPFAAFIALKALSVAKVALLDTMKHNSEIMKPFHHYLDKKHFIYNKLLGKFHKHEVKKEKEFNLSIRLPRKQPILPVIKYVQNPKHHFHHFYPYPRETFQASTYTHKSYQPSATSIYQQPQLHSPAYATRQSYLANGHSQENLDYTPQGQTIRNRYYQTSPKSIKHPRIEIPLKLPKQPRYLLPKKPTPDTLPQPSRTVFLPHIQPPYTLNRLHNYANVVSIANHVASVPIHQPGDYVAAHPLPYDNARPTVHMHSSLSNFPIQMSSQNVQFVVPRPTYLPVPPSNNFQRYNYTSSFPSTTAEYHQQPEPNRMHLGSNRMQPNQSTQQQQQRYPQVHAQSPPQQTDQQVQFVQAYKQWYDKNYQNYVNQVKKTKPTEPENWNVHVATTGDGSSVAVLKDSVSQYIKGVLKKEDNQDCPKRLLCEVDEVIKKLSAQVNNVNLVFKARRSVSPSGIPKNFTLVPVTQPQIHKLDPNPVCQRQFEKCSTLPVKEVLTKIVTVKFD